MQLLLSLSNDQCKRLCFAGQSACTWQQQQQGPRRQQHQHLPQPGSMLASNQVLLVMLGLGVLFGPDIYKAVTSSAADSQANQEPLDVDKGGSLGGRVHVVFCTS